MFNKIGVLVHYKYTENGVKQGDFFVFRNFLRILEISYQAFQGEQYYNCKDSTKLIGIRERYSF